MVIKETKQETCLPLTWFLYHCNIEDTQLFLPFSPLDTQMEPHITANISNNTELLFIQGKESSLP